MTEETSTSVVEQLNDKPTPSTINDPISDEDKQASKDKQVSEDKQANEGKQASEDKQANEDKQADEDKKKLDNSKFECNICLEFANEPVVSMCGHLFCWPCLHQWLITRPNQQLCPVCKASVSRENVIPLYGRHADTQSDPRDKVPPRPRAIRPEDTTTNAFSNWQFNDPHGNVQFSLGIGIFPISFIASIFNTTTTSFVGERRPDPPNNDSQQYIEERLLSQIFSVMTICFVLWLFTT